MEMGEKKLHEKLLFTMFEVNRLKKKFKKKRKAREFFWTP